MKKYLVAAAAGALTITASVALATSANGKIQVAQADDDAELFAALMEEGEDLYARWCGGCHGADGGGGTGPRLTPSDDGTPNATVSRAGSLAAQILSGNPDRGMPALGSNLSDREVSAIGTFVRNSWGNDLGILPENSVATRR